MWRESAQTKWSSENRRVCFVFIKTLDCERRGRGRGGATGSTAEDSVEALANMHNMTYIMDTLATPGANHRQDHAVTTTYRDFAGSGMYLWWSVVCLSGDMALTNGSRWFGLGQGFWRWFLFWVKKRIRMMIEIHLDCTIKS